MKKATFLIFVIAAMAFALVGCGQTVGAPTSVPQVTPDTPEGPACTLEVRCDVLLTRLDELEPGKAALVPEDGILLPETTVQFEKGETVFDVFRRILRQEKIHFEYIDASAYNSVYVEGIGNLYEFDCGPQSGWRYYVNGVYPGLSCGDYTLADGDCIVFAYSCDLGDEYDTSDS